MQGTKDHGALTRLLDAREVGAALGLSAKWVRSQVGEDGMLRPAAIRLGRTIRFRADAVAALITKGRLSGATTRRRRKTTNGPSR